MNTVLLYYYCKCVRKCRWRPAEMRQNKLIGMYNVCCVVELKLNLLIFAYIAHVSYTNTHYCILLTFKPESKLADRRMIVWIIIEGCTMYVPGSPVKLSATFVTAFNHQGTIAVVFKLWAFPGH